MAALLLLVGVAWGQTHPQTEGTAQQPADPHLARQALLRAQGVQLNELARQLEKAMDSTASDRLSLEVVRLSQQIKVLSHQMATELKTP